MYYKEKLFLTFSLIQPVLNLFLTLTKFVWQYDVKQWLEEHQIVDKRFQAV